MSRVNLLSSPGVRLIPGNTEGIKSVEVVNDELRFKLPWDRFIRLKVVAEALLSLNVDQTNSSILDVGGFDGAFAMFGRNWKMDLIDPDTTGGSGLSIPAPDCSYDYVVSIDSLEHVNPADRHKFLSELSRVSRLACLINFPAADTIDCQKLVLELTGHDLIREHVDYGLPDANMVVSFMENAGFTCEIVPSGSLSTWAAQFTLASFKPEAAAKISSYLVEKHADEPFSLPLYKLIVCRNQ